MSMPSNRFSHRTAVVISREKSPDAHPPEVRGQLVDAIRNGVRDIRSGEEKAVVLHPDRVAAGAPLPPGVRQPPEMLLLLRVHADHRLPGRLMLPGLLVDIPELGIPVRV